MPRTASDIDRFLDLALRMAVPLQDAIRDLMWRIGSNFDGATDPTPALPMLARAIPS